jgi:hypothetical protein
MANLIVPQVTIKWGDVNLSAYTFPGSKVPEPIAYDAEVSLPSDGNSSPTGGFMWNPSGPAYAVFEELATQKYKEKITIKFWYQGGPEIEFFFYYSGVEISYGVEMSVKIELSAISAFKTNATKSSASINYAEKDKDKGKDAVQAQKDIEGQYPNSLKLSMSKCAEKDAKEVKIKRVQFKDQTNGAMTQTLQQQLGNTLSLTNIGKEAELVAWAPYTWEAKNKCGTVQFPPKGLVKANERYGYILGPGIITSFSRKVSYTPPTSNLDSKPVQSASNPIPKKPTPAPGTNPTKATEETAKGQEAGKKGTQRPSSPSNVKGMEFSENPNGPQKQALNKEEEGVKLQAQLFMCPAIVGIKPQDIVYIPSLKTGSTQIEDYKVLSVSYSQQGATVGISIEASRTFGLSKPMYPEESKKFIEKANSLQTLNNWENYAWRERLGLPPV